MVGRTSLAVETLQSALSLGIRQLNGCCTQSHRRLHMRVNDRDCRPSECPCSDGELTRKAGGAEECVHGLNRLFPAFSIRPLSPYPCLLSPRCTHFRQRLSLLQHYFRRLLLLVRRIAVLAKNTLHQDTKLCSDVFPYRPIDGHVLLHHFR